MSVHHLNITHLSVLFPIAKSYKQLDFDVPSLWTLLQTPRTVISKHAEHLQVMKEQANKTQSIFCQVLSFVCWNTQSVQYYTDVFNVLADLYVTGGNWKYLEELLGITNFIIIIIICIYECGVHGAPILQYLFHASILLDRRHDWWASLFLQLMNGRIFQ